ncbi:hypothetical protein ACFX1T_000829 [Malus domestica]
MFEYDVVCFRISVRLRSIRRCLLRTSSSPFALLLRRPLQFSPTHNTLSVYISLSEGFYQFPLALYDSQKQKFSFPLKLFDITQPQWMGRMKRRGVTF